MEYEHKETPLCKTCPMQDYWQRWHWQEVCEMCRLDQVAEKTNITELGMISEKEES